MDMDRQVGPHNERYANFGRFAGWLGGSVSGLGLVGYGLSRMFPDSALAGFFYALGGATLIAVSNWRLLSSSATNRFETSLVLICGMAIGAGTARWILQEHNTSAEKPAAALSSAPVLSGPQDKLLRVLRRHQTEYAETDIVITFDGFVVHGEGEGAKTVDLLFDVFGQEARRGQKATRLLALIADMPEYYVRFMPVGALFSVSYILRLTDEGVRFTSSPVGLAGSPLGGEESRPENCIPASASLVTGACTFGELGLNAPSAAFTSPAGAKREIAWSGLHGGAREDIVMTRACVTEPGSIGITWGEGSRAALDPKKKCTDLCPGLVVPYYSSAECTCIGEKCLDAASPATANITGYAIANIQPGPTPIVEEGCYVMPSGATPLFGTARGPAIRGGRRVIYTAPGWIEPIRWNEPRLFVQPDGLTVNGFAISKVCVSDPEIMSVQWEGGLALLTDRCRCFGQGIKVPPDSKIECTCRDPKRCTGPGAVQRGCDIIAYYLAQ